MKSLLAVMLASDGMTSKHRSSLGSHTASIQNASRSLFGSETASDWKVSLSQIRQAMMSHVTISGSIFTASGTYKLEVMHLDLKGRPLELCSGKVYIYNVHIFRYIDTKNIRTMINLLQISNHIEVNSCQFYIYVE